MPYLTLKSILCSTIEHNYYRLSSTHSLMDFLHTTYINFSRSWPLLQKHYICIYIYIYIYFAFLPDICIYTHNHTNIQKIQKLFDKEKHKEPCTIPWRRVIEQIIANCMKPINVKLLRSYTIDFMYTIFKL